MATDAAKRPTRYLGRLNRSELIAVVAVMALVLITAIWLVLGDSLRPTNGQFGTNQKAIVDYFGQVYCRPACRSRFHRCEVSTGGFTYQQSRCQETLKQCLMVCDRGGRK